MITFNISSRMIKISVVLITLILIGAVSMPAISHEPEKTVINFADVRIFKLIETDPEPQSFVVTVIGLGVEKFQDKTYSLAEVEIYNNQSFGKGYAYCVLTGRQMQTVFQTAFNMGLDLRLKGIAVTPPEDTIYSGSRVYSIQSATSW